MQRTTQFPSRPAFVVDRQLAGIDGGHQIDWLNVADNWRVTPGQVITVSGAAALDAVSVPVNALQRAIVASPQIPVIVYFGTNEIMRITANAAAGATSVTVSALSAALEGGEVGVASGVGKKFLPAGTIVGTLLGTGKISPRVASTNPATHVLQTDALEDDLSAALSGYGCFTEGHFYENLMPDAVAGVVPSAMKTELATAGGKWRWSTYADDR
jgi:hypothetical protein